MKIIKRLVVILVIVLVIVIYITNKDNKIYYVSLGDALSRGVNETNKIGYGYSDYINDYLEKNNKLEFYTKKFSDKDLRTTDIINNIKDNIEIIENGKSVTIKKALVHSDILTLSTGLNEILYKLESENIEDYEMYKYIDELTSDIKDLVKLIKKYTKEDIILIGYYNPFVNKNRNDKTRINNVIIYANNKLIDICKEEDLYYIDTYNLFKSNDNVFTNINSYYPNIDGHKLISNKIISIIEKNIIKSTKTM